MSDPQTAPATGYTLSGGRIHKDGRPMLALVRAVWGDDSPTHAELAQAERDLGAIIEAARAAFELLTVGKAAQCLDVNPYSLPAVVALRDALGLGPVEPRTPAERTADDDFADDLQALEDRDRG